MTSRRDTTEVGRDSALSRSLEKLNGSSGLVAGVNICVIGGGFVGLVTAAGFAQFGHTVVCVEKDPRRLGELQAGRVPFYERDLDELLAQQMQAGRVAFSGDLEAAIQNQKAIFVTIGTPAGSDGRTDLGPLENVVRTLAPILENDQTLVLKSTVPVGTGRQVSDRLRQLRGEENAVAVINNPEFLREGSAVHDFFHPQRIVIGGDDPARVDQVAHLYRIGMTRTVPIVTTNNETAEMIKYASNAFIALKVGFANELAGLCDHLGVNVLEVARAMGMDPRIGEEYLVPGPGWGGSCLGKDLKELTGLAETHEYVPFITTAVQAANEAHHDRVVDKIRALTGSLEGTRIGVLGLAFKAGTSDVRDSPALAIARRLIDAGAKIVAFDPEANGDAQRDLPELKVAESAYDAVREAECLVILTEWHQFQALDYRRIADLMRSRRILDSRNLLIPETMQRLGFEYVGMGQA